MLRVSMERDRDDDFELPALKRRRKSLSLNRERFGHASTEEASVCSRGVVPKNTEKNDCRALDFEGARFRAPKRLDFDDDLLDHLQTQAGLFSTQLRIYNVPSF